jgi:N-acetylated-alpha-linked acidic dipeptidase
MTRKSQLRKISRILRMIHFPGRGFARTIKQRTGALRIVADWIKQAFGVPPPTDSELHVLSLRHAESWEEYMEYAADVDEKPLESLQHEKTLSSLPFPIFEFIRAAKRVAAVNKKLISFERGLISDEGIRDREWYRHLGVAPGKWLGELDHSELKLCCPDCFYRLRSDDIPWIDGGYHI